LLIVFSGLAIGIILGAISGFFGGYVDEVVMRITDIFFSIPSIVLAIAFVYVLSRDGFSGLESLVIALIVIWWPTYARLTRGVTLSVKSMKYIEASIASGASRIGIVFKHVLPNVLSPAFVQLSLDLGSIVLIIAALDFIQLPIISPFVPELGKMINDGESYLVTGMWWPVTIPGLFLLLFTVSVNLMGDGLRDVLDPKLRG
ncbi:MAG: ABC transporter permease, partial [Methanomassiliicoccales archaeon]